MTRFKGTMVAHRRTGLHVRFGLPVPLQSEKRIFVIAENDHGAADMPDCDEAMTQSIRDLICVHGAHAAQHMATVAQAAFWHGDMNHYHACLNIQKQLNRVISTQPISPTLWSTHYFV